MLRIERELDEARGRLMAIRQAKYKLKGGDTSGDETDTEITLHSTSGNTHNTLLHHQSTSPYQTSTLPRPDNNTSYQSDTMNNRSRTLNSTFGTNNTINSSFVNSSFNNSSSFGQTKQLSSFSSPQQQIEKSKYPSPPPPNPPPPMSTNLSTFSRSLNSTSSLTANDDSTKLVSPGQNYEGFTTR